MKLKQQRKKVTPVGLQFIDELTQTTGSPVLADVLQKSIDASIVNRSKLINGDMLHNPNYQFD
jgi:hypothetical protein